MTLSLAALAPLLVALVVVAALAVDVMWRLNRLRTQPPVALRPLRARRAPLALVASADDRSRLFDDFEVTRIEDLDTRPQRRRA